MTTLENGDLATDIDAIEARRARFRSVVFRIFRKPQVVEALEDGYALAFPATEEWTQTVEQYAATAQEISHVANARYEILAENENGRVWLHVRGPDVLERLREYLTPTWERSRRQWVARRKWEWRVRVLSNRLRVLPNFVLIGAPRCGTTTLTYQLYEHPCVVAPFHKEANFFDVNYHCGLPHYRAYFPTILEKRRILARAGWFCTGDATPTYMFHPHAPERLRRHLPRAKLIVVLRDPVERAYSLYQLKRRNFFETLSFEDAIACEDSRLEGELEKMLAENRYSSHTRHNFAYLSAGIYVDQLRSWKKLFPPEQLTVLSTDELKHSLDETHDKILEFLGLPEHPAPEPKTLHSVPRTEMDPSTRERLREFFRPHNERLWELLGVDYGWNR